jgi:hypothetical protein
MLRALNALESSARPSTRAEIDPRAANDHFLKKISTCKLQTTIFSRKFLFASCKRPFSQENFYLQTESENPRMGASPLDFFYSRVRIKQTPSVAAAAA